MLASADLFEGKMMLVLAIALAAAASQAPTAQTAQTDDDPIVCTRQNIGDEVGTRLQRKKVCMRKSDRDYVKQQEKQAVLHLINDGDDRMKAATLAPR
jgi:hypothetical protein